MLALWVLTSSLAAEEPPSQKAAEELARKRWFEFELAPVKTRFHGDGVAFVQSYEKEEPRRATSLGGKGAAEGRRPGARLPGAGARIHRRSPAARQGDPRDIEPLVDDCAMYSSTAKDRNELTRKYLTEHLAEL